MDRFGFVLRSQKLNQTNKEEKVEDTGKKNNSWQMRCLSEGAFRLQLSEDTFMEEGDCFHKQEEKGMAGMYGSNCIDLVGRKFV